jgi:hypothetical protein
MSNQVPAMAQYTSILLPLAKSRKRRLEEAAEARGETLETFILDAADAEAERIGKWLSERGHSVDHPIYNSSLERMGPSDSWIGVGDQQIDAQRVASELGWKDGRSEDWLSDVDRLINNLETLDDMPTASAITAPSSQDARRSRRRNIESVQVLNPVRGIVLNMSDTGLGIETQRPFSVPEEVHLSIGQAVASAKIRAEVRWCVLTRTESFHNGDVIPVYRSGLSFVGH